MAEQPANSPLMNVPFLSDRARNNLTSEYVARRRTTRP